MKTIYLLDIDGVLADYAGGFCRYYNWLCYKKLEPKDIAKIPFNDGLKLDKKLYDCVKYLYRKTGGEGYKNDYIKGAREFIKWAHNNGDLVYVWTTRPIVEFPNIKTETLRWLRDNGIKYDKIFFTDKKEGKELYLFNSQLMNAKMILGYKLIAVDDAPLSCSINKIVDEIYTFNQPYNKKIKGLRINNLLDLCKKKR